MWPSGAVVIIIVQLHSTKSEPSSSQVQILVMACLRFTKVRISIAQTSPLHEEEGGADFSKFDGNERSLKILASKRGR